MVVKAHKLSFRCVRVFAQQDFSCEKSLECTGKTDEREVFSVKNEKYLPGKRKFSVNV
jgi:hypothetical protein